MILNAINACRVKAIPTEETRKNRAIRENISKFSGKKNSERSARIIRVPVPIWEIVMRNSTHFVM